MLCFADASASAANVRDAFILDTEKTQVTASAEATTLTAFVFFLLFLAFIITSRFLCSVLSAPAAPRRCPFHPGITAADVPKSQSRDWQLM